MDTRTILADLKAELNRLNQAIATLESLDGTATATTPAAIAAPTQAKKRGLTPAGRRRLSEKMKARWAARRKQVAKPAPKKTSGRRHHERSLQKEDRRGSAEKVGSPEEGGCQDRLGSRRFR